MNASLKRKKMKTLPRLSPFSVLIVGAGASGIGMGIVFEKCGIKDYVILERNKIGSSFVAWPRYTRFISPSFCGNFFNAVDLNAVSPDTSPAFTLMTEHPYGNEYEKYLQQAAKHFTLKVRKQTSVLSIKKQGDVFEIETNKAIFTSRFVIWAGGEFSNPANQPFDGAEYCVHSSIIEDFPDNKYTIIGGFESGMELAAHLLSNGKSVTIIDAGEPWEVNGSDSSISLAPSTRDRLRPFIGTPDLRFIGKSRVIKVEFKENGYKIIFENKKHILSPTRPILATGFHPLSPVVQELFMQEEDGVALTEDDESTVTPGLFLVGPRVRHVGGNFCFIYKFRQRLPIVAEIIADRLNLSTEGLDEYKKANMYLKDLSCCNNECTC